MTDAGGNGAARGTSDRSAGPALSVVVLSHNRAELLRRTLVSVFAQDPGAREVIVVDNGSRDGSPEMVAREFPAAVLLRFDENLGIRARNEGFRKAQGELILSLDDDIELMNPECLRDVSARFQGDPQLGALSLKICDPGTGNEYSSSHWWHPLPRETHQHHEFATDHLSEAAVMFRAAALRSAGYYYEALFWGGEEWDLALGMIDSGYLLRYFPEPVLHLAPRGSLIHAASPRHALLIRNRCWIAFRRLPILQALAFTLPRIVLWAARAARFGYLGHYLRGIGGLFVAAPRIIRDRKPVSRNALRTLRQIQRQPKVERQP
ncbi:MAG: glycosyltransferase family 2 protein [Myxococcota bacterium]